MKGTRLIVVLTCHFSLCAGRADDEPRTWTATNGRTLEASLVGLNETHATLRKSDGTGFSVPVQSLSLDDQQFLQGNRARFEWIEDKAVPQGSKHYQEIVLNSDLRDSVAIYSSRGGGRESEKQVLEEAPPKALRERIHLMLPEAAQKFAVGNDGEVLFLTATRRMYRMTPSGTIRLVYDSSLPEHADKPLLNSEQAVGPLVGGGFLLSTLWKGGEGEKPSAEKHQLTRITFSGDEPEFELLGILEVHGPAKMQMFDAVSSNTVLFQFVGSIHPVALASLDGTLDHDDIYSGRRTTPPGVVRSQLSGEEYLMALPTFDKGNYSLYVDSRASTWSIVGGGNETIEQNEARVYRIQEVAISPDGKWVLHSNWEIPALMHLQIEGVHY